MAFFPGQDVGPGRIDPTRLSGAENRCQTLPGHHLWNADTREFQDGWRQIGQTDEIVTVPAARNQIGPPNHEWDTGPDIVQISLGAREQHTVITRHDDDRVFQFVPFLQFLQQLSDMGVER